MSIHQPNSDVFYMFDNIYCLAKGGICVYSGRPSGIKQHLIDCHIDCHQNQVPIEVLIKVSFDGIKNKNVRQLCDKTNEVINRSLNGSKQLKPVNNGLNVVYKKFSCLDFWYLLLRLFHRSYISNFKSVIQQFVSFIVLIIFCFKTITSVNITENDSCFELNSLSELSCLQLKVRDSSINYNILFTCTLIIFASIIQLLTFVVSYANDMKIFASEHKNCKFLHSFIFLFVHGHLGALRKLLNKRLTLS